MKVYLIENEKVVETIDNVLDWGKNFVEFLNYGYKAKKYCEENQYYTDVFEETEEVIV